MTALFVLRRLPPEGGGTERQVCALASALNELGENVRVIGGNIDSDRIPHDNKLIYCLPDSRLRFWGTLIFHWSLLGYLERHRKEITIAFTYFLNETTLLVALWGWLRNKRIVFKLSGSGKFGDLQKARNHWRARLVFGILKKSASAFIAVSQELLAAAKTDLGDGANIILISKRRRHRTLYSRQRFPPTSEPLSAIPLRRSARAGKALRSGDRRHRSNAPYRSNHRWRRSGA